MQHLWLIWYSAILKAHVLFVLRTTKKEQGAGQRLDVSVEPFNRNSIQFHYVPALTFPWMDPTMVWGKRCLWAELANHSNMTIKYSEQICRESIILSNEKKPWGNWDNWAALNPTITWPSKTTTFDDFWRLASRDLSSHLLNGSALWNLFRWTSVFWQSPGNA